VERLPGGEVERHPGPALHASQHGPQPRQPSIHPGRPGTHPGEVKTEGNNDLVALYERRFRDEFKPAFEAWLRDDPLNNPQAIPSPLLEKQYVLADAVKAENLEEAG
jgi:hypothetical protein